MKSVDIISYVYNVLSISLIGSKWSVTIDRIVANKI